MKTRYARAQEENAQLRATNSELLQDGYKLVAERDILRDTVMKLTAELEESITAMKLVNTQLILARSNPPVDDTRLREMALATAAQFGHTGDGVTARARSYLDFLKGDDEPKQPTLADGEGVFE